MEGINNYCYRLAFRVRGEQNHDNRIIIVAIDEKTLAKLGRWPIQRSYYTDLLGILDQAAVVGFNIIMSDPSEEDARLSRAITEHARLVLPAYIDRQLNIWPPEKIFSPAGLGHVHLEQGVDGFVKEVYHTISYQSYTIPSFASALKAVINSEAPPRLKFGTTTHNKKFPQILSKPATCGLISTVRRVLFDIYRWQTFSITNGRLRFLQTKSYW